MTVINICIDYQNKFMEKSFNEYSKWLFEKFNLKPNDTYLSVNCVDELVSMRDEILGLKGESLLVNLMKEDGVLEIERKRWQEKYAILTFDEWKKSFQ